MRLLLLVIGDAVPDDDVVAALHRHADVERLSVPAERAVIERVLAGADGRRLAVSADTTGLHALTRTLLRLGELADTPLGLVRSGADVIAAELGCAADPDAAADEILTAPVRPVALVRDDHGDVLLDEAELTPWEGDTFGVRAHVDDAELVYAHIERLLVYASIDEANGGRVRARTARRREGTLRSIRGLRRLVGGRAVTVSCEPARLVIDGVAQARPQTRRTWWCDPDVWSIYRQG